MTQLNLLAFDIRLAAQRHEASLQQKQEAFATASNLHKQQLIRFKSLGAELRKHMGEQAAGKYMIKVEEVVLGKAMERERPRAQNLSNRSIVVKLTVGLMQTYEKCQAAYYAQKQKKENSERKARS